MTDVPASLVQFVRGEADCAAFSHREHVRMAFEMLRRHDFVETALQYSRALRALTIKAGVPAKFHQTITVAFLSLVGERMQAQQWCDFDAFVQANPDLLDASVLGRLYSPGRLSSEAARRTFLLPQALPPPDGSALDPPRQR